MTIVTSGGNERGAQRPDERAPVLVRLRIEVREPADTAESSLCACGTDMPGFSRAATNTGRTPRESFDAMGVMGIQSFLVSGNSNPCGITPTMTAGAALTRMCRPTTAGSLW